MSFERPSKGLLVFQCDACFDTFEFSKAEGADVQNFLACWHELHADEGWRVNGGDHLCSDCSKTAKADRDNPFRR